MEHIYNFIKFPPIAQPQTLLSPGVSLINTLVLLSLSTLSLLPIPVAVYQPSANLYSQFSSGQFWSERSRYLWNQEIVPDLSEHKMTWACKLACMHAMCLCAQAHISAKLGQIREIKVSMESV